LPHRIVRHHPDCGQRPRALPRQDRQPGGVVNAAFTGTLTVTPSIIPAAADGAAPGAGTAITGGAFTMSATNSASGSTNSIIPTALNFVNEGDIINFVCSGATATAGPASFYAVIQAA
jgi:hypothetical protein